MLWCGPTWSEQGLWSYLDNWSGSINTELWCHLVSRSGITNTGTIVPLCQLQWHHQYSDYGPTESDEAASPIQGLWFHLVSWSAITSTYAVVPFGHWNDTASTVTMVQLHQLKLHHMYRNYGAIWSAEVASEVQRPWSNLVSRSGLTNTVTIGPLGHLKWHHQYRDHGAAWSAEVI